MPEKIADSEVEEKWELEEFYRDYYNDDDSTKNPYDDEEEDEEDGFDKFVGMLYLYAKGGMGTAVHTRRNWQIEAVGLKDCVKLTILIGEEYRNNQPKLYGETPEKIVFRVRFPLLRDLELKRLRKKEMRLKRNLDGLEDEINEVKNWKVE